MIGSAKWKQIIVFPRQQQVNQKNDSLSNPRPDNYTTEQTCTPLLTACNRCRTDGNRLYKPTYENEILHNVTTAASLRWKCITANSKICDWTNSKCADFDKRIREKQKKNKQSGIDMINSFCRGVVVWHLICIRLESGINVSIVNYSRIQ